MDVLISVLLDFLYITKFFIFCDYFLVLPKKSGRYRIMPVCIMTVIMSIICYAMASMATLVLVLYLGFIFLFYVFLYEGKWGKLFLISLWSNFTIVIQDRISAVIVNTILTILATTNVIYLDRFFTQLLSLGFLFVTGMLLRKKHKSGIKDIGIGYFLGFTILSCADFAILVYLGDFAINQAEVKRRMLFEFIFLLVSIGMLFQMAMVIFLVVSRNVYHEKEQLASKYLNEQKKYYEYLEMRERKTKKFRHDLRNHMFILNTLNQQKDYEKLGEYLEKMSGEIEAFGNNICVHNGIVDAILNKYADEAEQVGIKLKVIGHFPDDCRISAFGLCTIFSNLLSNALEAEQESQGNTIEMFCGYTEGKITVSIKNDSVGKKIEKDGKMETSKKDKWNHGFGLENVRECVERNQGELLIESEKDTFKVIVLLNNDDSL